MTTPAIIIQARGGSKRLPAKVHKTYAGKSMLDYLLTRLSYTKIKIILAIPRGEKKDFAYLEKSHDIQIFCGNEDNVLKRYYDSALKYKCDPIIRVTADNPFTSVSGIIKALSVFQKHKADLTYLEGLPYGTGCEVISFKALKTSYINAKDNFEKEHLTQYIYRNASKFNIKKSKAPKELTCPDLRLTVDNQIDFKRFKKIINLFQSSEDKYLLLKNIIKKKEELI